MGLLQAPAIMVQVWSAQDFAYDLTSAAAAAAATAAESDVAAAPRTKAGKDSEQNN
jgi:hypothetical protein